MYYSKREEEEEIQNIKIIDKEDGKEKRNVRLLEISSASLH